MKVHGKQIHRGKIAIFLVCILIIYVPYIVLNASFKGMGRDGVEMSDGVYYLAIDLLFVLLILRNIFVCHISLHKAIIPSILFGMGQCIFLLAGNYDIVFILRLISWFLILTGGYLFLKRESAAREYIIELLSWGYLFLSVCICYWEITVRTIVMITGMNEVYWVLPGISFAFLTKRKVLKILLIITVGVAVLLSLKSGAITAYLMALFSYFIITMKLNSTTRNKKPLLFFIIGVIILLWIWPESSLYLENKFGISWEEKTISTFDTQGSGRTEIWNSVISMIEKSDSWSLLWGHGHNMVIQATKEFSAHNDFLEILYDYGVLMLIIYFVFFFGLIKVFINSLMRNNSIALPLGVCLAIFLVLSMVSHLVIYPGLLYSFSIIWAICLSAAGKSLKKC